MSETKKIDAYSKVIRKLLANEKYTIDVYQREYKWQREHIAALIEDLESKFLNSFDSDKGREFIQTYPHYFLGSFVLSLKENKKFIIDGQQRLTSITLLLIFLRNLAKKENIEITKIDDLIYSEKYGNISYNIDVPERKEAMEKLFKSQQNDSSINEADDSIRNIYDRYDDIVRCTPCQDSNICLIWWIFEVKKLIRLSKNNLLEILRLKGISCQRKYFKGLRGDFRSSFF